MLLLDQGRVGGGSSSRGEGNVLRHDAPGGHAVWHELARRFPHAVRLRRKGSITLGDGLEHLEGEHLADARELEPALRPGIPGVYVEEDLQVDPLGTVRAIAATVPVREGVRVMRALPDRVQALGGEWIEAEAVVVATGADPNGPHDLDVSQRKGQLMALGPAPGLIRHKLIDARYPAEVAAVIEEALTGEVFVGSSRQDVWDVSGVDADINARMLARAVSFVPALAELPVTREWYGFRPYRPGGPFVGRRDSGVYAITGHEGAGVGLGPLHAKRLAREIAG